MGAQIKSVVQYWMFCSENYKTELSPEANAGSAIVFCLKAIGNLTFILRGWKFKSTHIILRGYIGTTKK